ncbi:MAG TPA: alpha/beta hydrolase, partial [Mycobacterium sp.]
MTRPTVAQALAWRPEALLELAAEWDAAADAVRVNVAAGPRPDWRGSAADAASLRMRNLVDDADAVAAMLGRAAAAARSGYERIAAARAEVFVAEDIGAALDRLGEADADAARDIDAAVDVSGQIAAMTPAERARLIEEAPFVVGNTNGIPWDMRFAANRINIAQAIRDETGTDRDTVRRIGFYLDLLRDVDDPAGSGQRVDRQILAFDPARSTLVELNGDLDTARSVAVLVPGMNTTIEGSAANTETARRFVTATHGEVAAITYLGGPFPHGGNVISALAQAADPHYALEMAPRLAEFSIDVDRTVDATGRQVAVTYVGHSYGGSILGTAEALGMTADRTLYVAA